MPTYEFYCDTYGGDIIATQAEFEQFAKRAYLLLNMYCRMNLDTVSADLAVTVNTAVCLQADFLYLNGYELSVEGISEGGFTVGKVRVDGGSKTDVSGWNAFLSPLALNLLASIGARHLNVAIDPFLPYPWGW